MPWKGGRSWSRVPEQHLAPGAVVRRYYHQPMPLGRSSEEQWLVQGLVPLLGSLLPGLNPLQPAFLDAVLAPGLPRHGGASAGPAKAQLLCLPVAFFCLNPLLLPAVRELAPGLVVSSPALGPFLWGDADSLLGQLRDLRLCLPGRFGLCFLWRRREVYGVLESMAFAVFRGDSRYPAAFPSFQPGPAPAVGGQARGWDSCSWLNTRAASRMSL